MLRMVNLSIYSLYKLLFSSSRRPSIGLLDMSGFENFPSNGFDQFLINVTNEKLQQYFMDYIFPREQRDYEIEGISWKDIRYHTNEDVLELLFQVRQPLLSYVSMFWFRCLLKIHLLFTVLEMANNG